MLFLKKYIKILNEDLKKKEATKPNNANKVDYAEPNVDNNFMNFSDPTSKGDLSTTSNKSSKEIPSLPGKQNPKTQSVNIDIPNGSSDVMRNFMDKTKNIKDTVKIPADNKNHKYDISDYELEDEVNDVPEPNTTENLPAVINKALSTKEFEPEITWHQLKNLPGYAIERIRGAFRPLFKSIMGAPLENVSVTTTLDKSTNKEDIKNLIGYIGNYGIKDDSFSLEAFDIDPKQYKIEKAYKYSLNGITFLILKENLMGNKNYYIYAAPGRETRLNQSRSTKQIR